MRTFVSPFALVTSVVSSALDSAFHDGLHHMRPEEQGGEHGCAREDRRAGSRREEEGRRQADRHHQAGKERRRFMAEPDPTQTSIDR